MWMDEPLHLMQDHLEMRWASPENPTGARGAGGKANAGRKGSATWVVPSGESRVLAEYQGGPGMIRRIWATTGRFDKKELLRGCRIDIYWEGENRPAVSAPWADFFGTALGRLVAFESALFACPQGSSYNCFAPMPFRKGFKVVITNESPETLPHLFYDIDYSLGDLHPENMLYFHAHWRRENPTTLQHDYEILPRVEGRGRYMGTNIGVIGNTRDYSLSWWGEGEVKIYLDGDTGYPTLCGTGTEDYIGAGWGMSSASQLYHGCHYADHKRLEYCFYRYHIPDPVWFHGDVRVTMQQIGCLISDSTPALRASGKPLYEAGAGRRPLDLSRDDAVGLFEREDDWCSTAYFYLDRPASMLPPLAPYAERIAGLI